MKCPHCLKEIHSHKSGQPLQEDVKGTWHARYELCPACRKLIIELVCQYPSGGWTDSVLVYPKGISRVPLSEEIPSRFADNYKEACLVLADSAKASAALSRRCLQSLLREKAKVKPSDLANEIQQVLDSGKLPSHLSEAIDAIRNIGNFAAHPIKSKSSGEIVDVEEGEAELNLDVLEGLFDFYFIQPALMKERLKKLNKKLAEAGKPPIKSLGSQSENMAKIERG